ncbi:hypothetical protein EJ06DRAFT_330101 [Trichodelitschia bisporula]|uniref:Uncharacterized protein n=1 Tax=Trichodelitschia bisporula TaxID=703511 RepID=A0A6G1I1R6_9PEZI|nr:hypothetical protein EJ06DRAFT_330101 [Trichodelitschia bisporula]
MQPITARDSHAVGFTVSREKSSTWSSPSSQATRTPPSPSPHAPSASAPTPSSSFSPSHLLRHEQTVPSRPPRLTKEKKLKDPAALRFRKERPHRGTDEGPGSYTEIQGVRGGAVLSSLCFLFFPAGPGAIVLAACDIYFPYILSAWHDRVWTSSRPKCTSARRHLTDPGHHRLERHAR